ncbi:hypothetical protein [Okeania sp. KiyG1]|nr:hypothetical protein [Okeania sp. KiyG1]
MVIYRSLTIATVNTIPIMLALKLNIIEIPGANQGSGTENLESKLPTG